MTETQTEIMKNHNNFSGDLTVEDFSTFSPNKKRINTQMVNTYSKNMERLKQLEKEYDLELSRHGWYFGEYGESNG